MKKLLQTGLSWIWVALIVIAIDRFSKLAIIQNLTNYQTQEVLPFFNLTLAFNTGAAFSFLHSASGWQNIVFSLFAIVISVILLVWLYRNDAKERWQNIALCLILGGALGNLWDRIQFQSVIDFFDFHLGDWHFAIFNTADAAIFIGAVMVILYWVVHKET